MAGIVVSPGNYSQIGKRRTMYKSRGESPTFKDVLRDRCHSRIKARRNSLFEQFRNMRGNDELRKTLSELLHEEVNVLKSESEKPMDIEECLYIDDYNQDDEDRWIIEEYEKILAEEEATFNFDWDKEVICPLCEKAVLKQNNDGTVNCNKCKSELPSVFSLQYLRDRLNCVLTEHHVDCNERPQFALINDSHTISLYLICDICGFFSLSV